VAFHRLLVFLIEYRKCDEFAKVDRVARTALTGLRFHLMGGAQAHFHYRFHANLYFSMRSSGTIVATALGRDLFPPGNSWKRLQLLGFHCRLD
jgi:hypothetical protein